MTSLDSHVKIRYRGGEMTLTGSNLIHEEIHRLEVELRVERAVLKRAAKAGITGWWVDAVADRVGSIGDKVANLKKDLKRLQGT